MLDSTYLYVYAIAYVFAYSLKNVSLFVIRIRIRMHIIYCWTLQIVIIVCLLYMSMVHDRSERFQSRDTISSSGKVTPKKKPVVCGL